MVPRHHPLKRVELLLLLSSSSLPKPGWEWLRGWQPIGEGHLLLVLLLLGISSAEVGFGFGGGLVHEDGKADRRCNGFFKVAFGWWVLDRQEIGLITHQGGPRKYQCSGREKGSRNGGHVLLRI